MSSAPKPADTNVKVRGSDELTVITAKSVPATNEFPEEGRITASIADEAAAKVLPSKRVKLVWSRVAEKVAFEKRSVSGNCTLLGGMSGPEPISPKGMTWAPVVSTKVRVLNRKLSDVNTGKSGGKANPPVPGSPVKLEMLKALTPGVPGIRTSKEIKPMSMVLA